MKKIHSNKFFSYFLVLDIIILIAYNILSIYLMIDYAIKNNYSNCIIFGICDLIVSSSFILFIFYLNRLGCIIEYDKEKEVLYRRGYLFGYKSILKVAEIIKIEKATLEREGEYYIIIDKIHMKYESGSKKSFYRVPYGQEGKEFIKQFFDLEIN